jgi:hypothetical protein
MDPIFAWLRHRLQNQALRNGLFFLGSLVFLTTGILTVRMAALSEPVAGALAAASRQDELPTYNWYVCGDLGVGSVPGLPGVYQRLELCHRQGWLVLAYCIEPQKPPPPMDTVCARINVDTFWCGDEYQLLRTYDIHETPTPSPEDTATAIPSPTPTATRTQTPSPTVTFTATSTATATATATATSTVTSTTTFTPSATLPSVTIPPADITGTPTSTPPVLSTRLVSPTPRVVPGGEGNLSTPRIVLWGVGLLLGLGFLSVWLRWVYRIYS